MIKFIPESQDIDIYIRVNDRREFDIFPFGFTFVGRVITMNDNNIMHF